MHRNRAGKLHRPSKRCNRATLRWPGLGEVKNGNRNRGSRKLLETGFVDNTAAGLIIWTHGFAIQNNSKVIPFATLRMEHWLSVPVRWKSGPTKTEKYCCRACMKRLSCLVSRQQHLCNNITTSHENATNTPTAVVRRCCPRCANVFNLIILGRKNNWLSGCSCTFLV